MRTTYEILTEEQYLIREPEAEYKSEYRDGEVVAMGGASLAHSTISMNIAAKIHHQLEGKPCCI